MEIIETRVDTSSNEYQENYRHNLGLVDHLNGS